VVAAIIPGAKHAAKVRENAELMSQPIPGALWDELRREGLLPDGAPTAAA
jgi:D-threo-aldose 1-dehydrogenase